MKTIVVRSLVLSVAAQWALSAGTVVTDLEALSNQALALSPRAREEFPALTRAIPAAAARPAALVIVAAASGGPRMIEANPALSRTQPMRLVIHQTEGGVTGRGLAANPRAAEENPALTRGLQPPQFQIAPLK